MKTYGQFIRLCIMYVVLLVFCEWLNAMLYCVFRIPNAFFWHSHNLIPWNQHGFLKTLENIWAIHTTLYRVCCIEFTWLYVNAQFYVVLCISYFKCIFFWHSHNSIPWNQYNFLKNFWKHMGNSYDFVSCMLYWILLVVCEWLNAMLYCVFRILNPFFLAFTQFDSPKPTLGQFAQAVVSLYWVYCWKFIQQRMLVVDNFYIKIRCTYTHFFSNVFKSCIGGFMLSKCVNEINVDMLSCFSKVVLVSGYQIV